MARFRNSIAAIVLGFACAFAAAGAPAAAAKETILTEDSATRFVDSFPEMRDLAVSQGMKIADDPDVAKDPMKAVINTLKKGKLGDKVQAIASAHGFVSAIDWADTGSAVARAYIYVTLGPSRSTARDMIRQNKDEAISQLEKMGILNADGKKKLRESLQKAEDELSHKPPEENIAVVKKIRKKIDMAMQIGESDDDGGKGKQ